MAHTCPWWFAYTFDNPLRGLVHRPSALLEGLVASGDTVVDVGCGLGFFTIGMAELVGPAGRVIAIDLQQEMLDRTRKRAERRGLADRIEFRKCTADRLDVGHTVDFVLAFWMLHEVADQRAFLSEVHAALKPTGHLLVAEPKGHVSPAFFDREAARVREAGFQLIDGPHVRWSRAMLCAPQK